jgi:SAM-dependent methyltransferase
VNSLDFGVLMNTNRDNWTIEGFGDEWSRFDQSRLSINEKHKLFNDYFKLLDWNLIDSECIGFDAGCGSGRWASLVAPKVKHLVCVDPSVAIEVAQRNLKEFRNVSFLQVDVGNLPFEDDSMDFGYSLGVLHHIPDTQKALRDCVKKLKKGSQFLLYLYYRFDNRPSWFRYLWELSEWFRFAISRLPFPVRSVVCQFIAFAVYLPLARVSWLFEKFGISVENWPLSAYRDRSFYTMRTDALDRFGTRLEQRFTKKEIQEMMTTSGLVDLRFNDEGPGYWTAVGKRAF